MYLCKFDEAGKRIATVLKGVHFKTKAEKQKYLDQGYIDTSDEDYAYYVGNRGNGDNGTGYIRGKDGKPVSAPAYVPTKEEKLAQLDAKYDSDKAQLREYIGNALLLGDDELISDLRAEMTALDEVYESDRGAIENE